MGVFRKNGSWWIDFYHRGKRSRRKVGPSKKVAEMALADVQVKKAKNEFLGICEPKRMLFNDFALEYLEHSKANKAKSTHKQDVRQVKRHFSLLWGNEPIDRITPKMIEDFKHNRVKHVKAATVNRELSVINHMFRKAIDWGYLTESPTAKVKKLKAATPHFRYLSSDEVALLLRSCKEAKSPQLYPFVVTALNTGMRLGEMTALEWEDIDFKQAVLCVDNKEAHHTKNYEPRTIPINDQLMSVLRRIPRRLDSRLVFHGRQCRNPPKFHSSFKNAVKRAGIPHVRFHDLRHTFASHLVMAGVDIRTVQELLGHKDITVTMRYSHLSPDHMKNAVRILDSHYLDTGQGSNKEESAG